MPFQILKIVVSGSYTQNGNKDHFSCCFSLCFSHADKSYIFDYFTAALYVFIGEKILSAERVVRLGFSFQHSSVIYFLAFVIILLRYECHFQMQSALFGITDDSSTVL